MKKTYTIIAHLTGFVIFCLVVLYGLAWTWNTLWRWHDEAVVKDYGESVIKKVREMNKYGCSTPDGWWAVDFTPSSSIMNYYDWNFKKLSPECNAQENMKADFVELLNE